MNKYISVVLQTKGSKNQNENKGQISDLLQFW